MAESSLSVGRTELREYVANFLGYGRTSANWSTAQGYDIDQAVNAGTARFYAEKDWLFLSVQTTITTTASDDEQDMPDDFGYLKEGFRYPSDKVYAPPVMTSVGHILAMRATSTSNGIITHFAINPKSQTGVAGTRYEVLWYPPPQEAWALVYTYAVLRDALSATYPYPAGSAATRNAIVEACLAEADRLINDNIGIHEQAYQAFVLKAREHDGRNDARNLGPNLDSSDLSSRNERGPAYYCKYNGSVPS